MISSVHYRHGEGQGRRAHLTDEKGAATETANGVLRGNLKRVVFTNELAAVHKDPPAHVMSFQIVAHCLIGRDFVVEIRHHAPAAVNQISTVAVVGLPALGRGGS